MRLSGPVPAADNPASWVEAHRRAGYSAAAWPPCSAEDPRLPDFLDAARKADLIIAEVGAWSNPISSNEKERAEAFDKCCRSLDAADRIGTRCCVNIAGSRDAVWDGPHPENLSDETFDMIVQCVRKIIDTVKPRRTFYALETMPWIFPDSPDSYLALIRAIDRKQFAVHLDPVNMLNCPQRVYRNGDFLRECFAKLGPYIRGCHAKDIKFTQHLTLHLDECPPGTGVLDYTTFLQELAKLDPDTPLVFEHMKTPEEYTAAGQYVRGIANKAGVKFR